MGSMLAIGPRKLLRTLSTVSIHETVDGVNGLAAMGPIGHAIMDGRDTAADAPPSEMPREFSTLREEEEESRSAGDQRSGSVSKGNSRGNAKDTRNCRRRGKSGESGSSSTSDDGGQEHVKGGHEMGMSEDRKSNETPSVNATAATSPAAQQKKKEKRFILF